MEGEPHRHVRRPGPGADRAHHTLREAAVIIQCGHCGAKYKVNEERLPRAGLTCKSCQAGLPLPPASDTRGLGGAESTIVGRLPTPSGAPLSAASAVRLSLVIQSGPDGGEASPIAQGRGLI